MVESVRLVYATLALLYVRDWFGCFYLNMTRRAGSSVRKPLAYSSAAVRRPRWCSIPVFRLLCAPPTQRLAFASALAGALLLAAGSMLWPIRCVVAAAVTVVELRFHAYLGWHRMVLTVNLAWAHLLPHHHHRGAVLLALAHCYAGSGLTRLRAQGWAALFDGGSEFRHLFQRRSANVLYPSFVDLLSGAPLSLLWALATGSRLCFELGGVGVLLVFGPSSRAVRVCFAGVALCFHAGIAHCLAIDFFENKCMLLVVILSEIYNPVVSGAEGTGLSFWLTAAYCSLLFAPVLMGWEAFPLTHNGLFPYSASQMRLANSELVVSRRVLAAIANGTTPGSLSAYDYCDLGSVCFGCSAQQPAQCYHAELLKALGLLQTGQEEAAAASLCRWLKGAPLLHPRSLAAYDTIIFATDNDNTIAVYHPPARQQHHPSPLHE